MKTIGNVVAILLVVCTIIGMYVYVPKIVRQIELESQQNEIMVKTEINKRMEDELRVHWYNPFYKVENETSWFTLNDLEVKYIYSIANGEYTYMYEYEDVSGIDSFIETVKRAVED